MGNYQVRFLGGKRAEMPLPYPVQKMFISSLDKYYEQYATNILSQVAGGDPGANLNSIYILIKPDNKAYVYSIYPFGTKVI